MQCYTVTLILPCSSDLFWAITRKPKGIGCSYLVRDIDKGVKVCNIIV